MTDQNHVDLSAFLDMSHGETAFGAPRSGLTPSMLPSLSQSSMGNDHLSQFLDMNMNQFDSEHISTGSTPMFGLPLAPMDELLPSEPKEAFGDPMHSVVQMIQHQPAFLPSPNQLGSEHQASVSSVTQSSIPLAPERTGQGATSAFGADAHSPSSTRLANLIVAQQPHDGPNRTDKPYHQRILQYHRSLAQNQLGREALPAVPIVRGPTPPPTQPVLNGTGAGLSLQERRRVKRLQQQQALAHPQVQHQRTFSTPVVPGSINDGGGNPRKRSVAKTESMPDIQPPATNRRRTSHMSQVAFPRDLTASHDVTNDGLKGLSNGGENNRLFGSAAIVPGQLDSSADTLPPSAALMQHPYSSSGFDVLKALTKVASRPNQMVNIGPVDQSCSFTVVDVDAPDSPMVYCSDTFLRLTGYARHEVIGRNCRFLQAPAGLINKGSERQATDHQAVEHMAKFFAGRKECQASLINYRKDGHPFINLVTIVPITWDDPNRIKYMVGFQIDLVERPGSIVEKMPDGSYFVNYSSLASAVPTKITASGTTPDPAQATSAVPRKSWTATTIKSPEELAIEREIDNAQHVAEAVSGQLNDSQRWAHLVLENSHDLTYVLSLKGTVLYVSSSVERILGFKPSELIGRSIADFTHPSDVVPVFRELKDSTSNASIAASARSASHRRGRNARDAAPIVNLLFRMRCNNNSYRWIESSGKLHLEQGKGRKVVVSSGRPRPVYHLDEGIVTRAASTQLGFWARVSTEGLYLNVMPPVTNVLRLSPGNLMGKSFKDVCEPDAVPALSRAVKLSYPTSVLHNLPSSEGTKMTVVSSFYPSPMVEHGTVGATPHMSVWAHVARATTQQVADLTPNAVIAAEVPAEATEANNTFKEMATLRESSWCYELHLLKNTNRRLKEDLRATHRKRLASRTSSPSLVGSPAGNRRNRRTSKSTSLSDAAIRDMLYCSLQPQPGEQGPFAPIQGASSSWGRFSSGEPSAETRASGASADSGAVSRSRSDSGSGPGSGSASGSGESRSRSLNSDSGIQSSTTNLSSSTRATSLLPLRDSSVGIKTEDRPRDMRNSTNDDSSTKSSLMLGADCLNYMGLRDSDSLPLPLNGSESPRLGSA